jgi:hypothetical protein
MTRYRRVHVALRMLMRLVTSRTPLPGFLLAFSRTRHYHGWAGPEDMTLFETERRSGRQLATGGLEALAARRAPLMAGFRFVFGSCPRWEAYVMPAVLSRSSFKG